MAYKQFTPDVLSSGDVNTYLMKQAVVTFASSAARNTALGASIPIGMVTFLTDSDSFWFYDGTNWVNLGISMTYPTATARTAAISAPVEGMQTYLADSNTFWYYDGTAWTNLGNVMRFASAAARTSALPSPAEGMVSYLQDVDELEVYNGASWLRVVVTGDDENITTSGTITSSGSTVTGTAASTNILAKVENLATNGYSTLLLGTSLQNNAGIWRNGSANGAYGGNNSINIGTVGAEPVTLCTTNTVRVTLDASGRMLIPNQPAFQAFGPVSAATSGTNPVKLTNVHVNRGSVYNTSTGFFTAPVAGCYMFHWSFLAGPTNDVYRFYLRKNGVRYDEGLQYRADTSATGSEYNTNAARVWHTELVAGDTVSIDFVSDAANAFYNGGGNAYSSFGGHLIG